MKLFVGGLSWNTSSEQLRSAFEPYGAVSEAAVISDRETGRSRGFGFVTMDNDNEAREAITKMNGQQLDGRTLNVNEARSKR